MSKKHFIALADMIREHNDIHGNSGDAFTETQILALAGFCSDQNWQFNRNRWLDYIAGKCGRNGGTIKPQQEAA